ncbi:hypothetical protein CHARACLAT_021194 [Characodon lateralis]|uniref:Uncharacterized protein n=1 Tax=Characodon lateralis TaxID=208331 RepID=A0ABU7F4T1_9TELE|nr:hypothetical protein [Characodon lateralis]
MHILYSFINIFSLYTSRICVHNVSKQLSGGFPSPLPGRMCEHSLSGRCLISAHVRTWTARVTLDFFLSSEPADGLSPALPCVTGEMSSAGSGLSPPTVLSGEVAGLTSGRTHGEWRPVQVVLCHSHIDP